MNFYNKYNRMLDEYKRPRIQGAKHKRITKKNKTMNDDVITVSPRCTADMSIGKYNIPMISEIII